MTTFMREPRTCFVCGHESLFQETTSTNSFGSPDLDLRPPEMKRSTMMTWVHKCPQCGYASESVTDRTSVNQEWLQSPEYTTCEGIRFKSDLAKQFYQAYLVKREDGLRVDAFYALIHAAWSSDDCRDEKAAIHCRKLAIDYVDDLRHAMPENRDTYLVMKADLMRRAGFFAKLRQEYESIQFRDELLNQIIAFQLDRADAHDTKCYTVRDAVTE